MKIKQSALGAAWRLRSRRGGLNPRAAALCACEGPLGSVVCPLRPCPCPALSKNFAVKTTRSGQVQLRESTAPVILLYNGPFGVARRISRHSVRYIREDRSLYFSTRTFRYWYTRLILLLASQILSLAVSVLHVHLELSNMLSNLKCAGRFPYPLFCSI